MRVPWLAVLAVAALVFLWLQREPVAERSPATGRDSGPQEAPQGPGVGPSAPVGDPQEEAVPRAQPAAEAGQNKGIPDDPIERGPCSLFLRAVSEDTGKPVHTEVFLYRLDAPGNEHWTEGDRWQATITIAKAGTLVEALPEGDYRVFALGQRRETDDPPAFRVSGARTEHLLRIPMPRCFQVYLLVYDERGQALRHANQRADGSKSGSSSGPDWLKKRQLRNAGGRAAVGVGRGIGGHTSHSTERQIRAGPAGFDFGLRTEDTRFWKTTASFRVKFEQRNEVYLDLKGDAARDRTYIAVALPVHLFRGVALLPDGRRAVDAGARITAACEAVLETADTAHAWQSLPVTVLVMLAGYEPFAFDYRLDQPAQVHTLKPVGKAR